MLTLSKRVDDTLEALSGLKWFSTLDLFCGYWKVEIEEGDRHEMAFCKDFEQITALYSMKEPERQLARWLEQIQKFDFEVQ